MTRRTRVGALTTALRAMPAVTRSRSRSVARVARAKIPELPAEAWRTILNYATGPTRFAAMLVSQTHKTIVTDMQWSLVEGLSEFKARIPDCPVFARMWIRRADYNKKLVPGFYTQRVYAVILNPEDRSCYVYLHHKIGGIYNTHFFLHSFYAVV